MDPSEPSPAEPAPTAVLAGDQPVPQADATGDEPDPDSVEDDPRRNTRRLVEWFVVVAGALIVALVIKTFLIQAFYIPSQSMEPTLHVGDRVLVNKLSYDLHDINRGDLVVFERPPGASGEIQDLIKRVIGLPGDTLWSHDGRVVVNGRFLEEPYLVADVSTTNLPLTEVPEGHVFVMGDNRSQSQDSRVFGAVAESDIVGRAFVRVWPVPDVTGL